MRALGYVIVGFEVGCAYDDFLFTRAGVTYCGAPRELSMLFLAALVLGVLHASRKAA